MDPFTIVAGISAIVGGISSIIGGKKAARAAKKEAALDKAMEAAITQEKVRQMNVEERVLRGETISQVAGSGVKVDSGSPLLVLAEQAREFSRQREVTIRAGATRTAAIGQRAANVAQQARYQSFGNAMDQFASAFRLFGGT